MLARCRVLQPLIEALLAVPGTTPADAARTLRTWADIIEGRDEEPAAPPA
jgi:hypothetical protein